MTGIKGLSTVLLGALTVGAVEKAASQAEVRQQQDAAAATPTFFFDSITYASDQKGKSRIDFYILVPYVELRFVKEGEQYAARYDVTLNISDTDQKVLQERTWSVDVRLPDISQTTSTKLYSLTQRDVDIDPGPYRITVQVKDEDSRKSGRIQRSLLVTDYERDSLSLSDIMLVSRLTTSDDGKRKVVPNIRGSIGTEDQAFFLYFEIYNHQADDSVSLTWKVFDSKKKELRHASSMEAMVGSKTQTFLKVDTLNLPVGTYLVTVEARPKRDTLVAATTSRTFLIRWADIPISITDIDKAVEQMRYIAEPPDFDNIRNAPSPEEKRKRFLDFWTKRDPDPSTPRNELMEEYYRRVEYSNKNFTHYLEGWKTDMGMVYIRFGPPENVERHPFDMNSKPYEVWYYYQLERQFIFVDDTGFGDYRLRYPTTDLWGRVR